MQRVFFVLTILVSMTALVFAQIPEGFEIVTLTDDPEFDSFANMNNCGEIVWSKRVGGPWDFDAIEVFYYDNGKTVMLTDNDYQDDGPDINDHGTIVWVARIGPPDPYGDDTHEVMRYEDGVVTRLTNDTLYQNPPRINNLGHVVWTTFTGGGCGTVDSELFLYDGTTIQQITFEGLSNQCPELNDLDEVVWTHYNFCESPWVSNIMLYTDGTTQEVSDGDSQPQSPHINNQTQISWTAVGGDEDLLRYWEDGEATTLADPVEFAAIINNHGDIATVRRIPPEAPYDQVWLYRAEQEDLVQVTDDPFGNWAAAMNDDGEIVLRIGTFPDSDLRYMRRIRNGDVNFDGNVDLDDFVTLADCMTGPVETDRLCECRFFDMDHDRDVDLRDFALFQTAFGLTP